MSVKRGGTGRVHAAAWRGLRDPGLWFVFFAAFLLLGPHHRDEGKTEEADVVRQRDRRQTRHTTRANNSLDSSSGGNGRKNALDSRRAVSTQYVRGPVVISDGHGRISAPRGHRP